MRRVRKDPEELRGDVFGRARVTLVAGVLAWVVRSYGLGDWPDGWPYVELDVPDRFFPTMTAVLGLVGLGFLAGTAVAVAQWRTARRYERWAQDPELAARVPPEARHDSVRRSGRLSVRAGYYTVGVFLGSWVAVILAALAFYGVLVLLGEAPTQEDDSRLGKIYTGVFLALFATACLVPAVALFRRWYSSRTVERLSEDPNLVGLTLSHPALVSPRRASAIPSLDVRFQPPIAGRYAELHQVTREKNVIDRRPWRIAYLRLFDNEPRVRDFMRGAWREFGYVHLIRSAASVSPTELREAHRLGTTKMFINTRARMSEELYHQPVHPLPRGRHRLLGAARGAVLVKDAYGSYPVRALLCHGGFWKSAVDTLLTHVDLVVIDLSGYRRENEGTRFELQRVIDRVPVHRFVLLTDASGDRAFLEAQIREAWSHMAHGSPNSGSGQRAILVAQTSDHGRYWSVRLGLDVAARTRPLLVHLHNRLTRAESR